MKDDIEALKREITVLRETMENIAAKKKFYFCDREVIAASVQLDEVLIAYQRLLARKTVKGARRDEARA